MQDRRLVRERTVAALAAMEPSGEDSDISAAPEALLQAAEADEATMLRWQAWYEEMGPIEIGPIEEPAPETPNAPAPGAAEQAPVQGPPPPLQQERHPQYLSISSVGFHNIPPHCIFSHCAHCMTFQNISEHSISCSNAR